jgi:hypothetical protein
MARLPNSVTAQTNVALRAPPQQRGSDSDMTKSGKRWLAVGLVVLLVGGGYYAWLWLKPQPLSVGFASGADALRQT